jgi:hypothetical protein
MLVSGLTISFKIAYYAGGPLAERLNKHAEYDPGAKRPFFFPACNGECNAAAETANATTRATRKARKLFESTNRYT